MVRSNKRKIYEVSTLGLLGILLLIFATGCTNANQQTESKTITQTDSSSHKDNSSDDVKNQLTLPVLNALFYEEGFENELKTKTKLSDSEIANLKEAAGSATNGLSEDNTTNISYRDALKEANTQIAAILGPDKAAQFYRFIADRSQYNGGTLPLQPNTIPSDTRIVVNTPAFRMDIFQDGKLVKTYKIGIGYPEFPLPTGIRKAESIIFNPTWTPPDEPWVKGKVSAGKKVAAGSKLNPLGPIKIPIGLPSLIHGGKAVSKLGNFASHGCVGLTNPQVQDFTAWLTQISGMSISQDSINGFAEHKTKTKTVKLNKSIYVELRYETIVAENGSLHIYRDVYEHGTNTSENAARVLAAYGVKYESLNSNEKQSLDSALNQMNRDAKGNLIAGNTSSTTDTVAEKNESDSKKNNGKTERAKKGKVTNSVSGQKEIIVPIESLKGKGYPAPVDLDDGTSPKAPKMQQY